MQSWHIPGGKAATGRRLLGCGRAEGIEGSPRTQSWHTRASKAIAEGSCCVRGRAEDVKRSFRTQSWHTRDSKADSPDAGILVIARGSGWTRLWTACDDEVKQPNAAIIVFAWPRALLLARNLRGGEVEAGYSTGKRGGRSKASGKDEGKWKR